MTLLRHIWDSKVTWVVCVGVICWSLLGPMIGRRVYDARRGIGWLTEETDHLILYYRAGSYAAENIERARVEYENAYLKLKSQIPVQQGHPPRKMHIFLHGEIEGNRVGYARPKRFEAHHLYSRQRRLTTAHEMMHVMLHRYNPKAPGRFEEGVCRYFEWLQISDGDRTALCEYYRLAKLRLVDEWDIRNAFLPRYETTEQAWIAAACVSYLMQAMGRDRFWEFYRHATARNYRSLLEATLNAELDEINAALQEHIRSFEDPPALFWEHFARSWPFLQEERQ